MADKGAFVVVQNAIAAPDEAWPHIIANLKRALHEYHCDHVRLPLLSPQENMIMQHIGRNYLIRLELVTLRGIQRDWSWRWIDQLFDVALTMHAGIEWYPDSGRRVSVPKWYLDNAQVLVLIKTNHDPELFGYLVETALDMHVPIVRIDPESEQMVRVVNPERKESEDEPSE